MKDKMDKILLIDQNNQVHRSNVNFNSFGYNPEVNTNFVMVFNYFRNLRPLIELLTPDKIFIALEGHPTFRYNLLPSYKANRLIKQASIDQSKKDEFNKCREIINDLLYCFPVTMVKANEYEADDVIGTLCENLKDEDITVLSSDKDHLQLLQKPYLNVKVYDPIKKCYQTKPEMPFLCWKALNGDPSDEIPKLLSPKKALATATDPELLKKFLSIKENRANFHINLELVTFKHIKEEELIITEGKKDFVKVKEEFIKMGFNSITNEKSWNKFSSTFDCIKF